MRLPFYYVATKFDGLTSLKTFDLITLHSKILVSCSCGRLLIVNTFKFLRVSTRVSSSCGHGVKIVSQTSSRTN